jgi:hypothetical protein
VLAISTVSVLSVDLPEPNALADISFNEPTVVVDRSGKVELGRFQRERRRVVDYAHVPRLVLDATTTAEDRSFWSNAGVDFPAIVSAAAGNAAGANERGASTITQHWSVRGCSPTAWAAQTATCARSPSDRPRASSRGPLLRGGPLAAQRYPPRRPWLLSMRPKAAALTGCLRRAPSGAAALLAAQPCAPAGSRRARVRR